MDPSVAGAYCELHATCDGWAEWLGRIWVEGTTTIRLVPGCRVTLDVGSGWREHAGAFVDFAVDGRSGRQEVRDRLVVLGTYAGGSLRVSSVGNLRAGGASRLPHALPRSGELTVHFVAEEVRPSGIRLLTGPKSVRDVSLSVVSGNLGLGGRLVRARPSGDDEFDLLDLGPGDRVLHYLATSGGEHAAGKFDVVAGRLPRDHEMEWHRGTELRATLPEGVVAAELTVLALDPAGPRPRPIGNGPPPSRRGSLIGESPGNEECGRPPNLGGRESGGRSPCRWRPGGERGRPPN
jgi:hypothetical protein